MAAEALGSERVTGVAMPSVHSSPISLQDAQALAESLGIRLEVIEIGGVVDAFEEALAPLFAGRAPDVTEENLQARARGTLLMAVSNKFGCSCWPPATSRRSRSATARSTATWSAASPPCAT